MSDKRSSVLDRIRGERERQVNLPGSEWDVSNGINEWCAIAAHYLLAEVRRGGVIPTQEDFEDSLVKAAAVILAALESSDHLKAKGQVT